MKLLMQREYFNKCCGQVHKTRFGLFYHWKIYFPESENPFAKGLSFTFFGAIKKCNYWQTLYSNNNVSDWKIL